MTEIFRSYAQNAEDVVLMRALAGVRQGTYVDIGAADPTADNVTYAFYLRGWRGVNIEPDVGAYERLVRQRPRDRNLNIGVGAARATLTYHHFPGTGLSTFDPAQARVLRAEGRKCEERLVRVHPLNEVIARTKLGEIHFLKIDVEGFEQQVLQGLDLTRIRPWVVVIESTRPGTTELVDQGWSELLTGRGYRRCLFDGINVFYCAQEHPEIAERLTAPANVLDNYERASAVAAVEAGNAKLRVQTEVLQAWRNAFMFGQRMRAVDLGDPDPTLSARGDPPSRQSRVFDGALLVDVTRLMQLHVVTGIQRVALNLTACLVRMEHALGSRLVLVERSRGRWLRVRSRLSQGDPVQQLALESTGEPVAMREHDQLLFTSLDYDLAELRGELDRLRRVGVRMTFWVYDLFPLARPDWSAALETVSHARWWNLVATFADRIVCDSWKVLVEVREWLAMFPPVRRVDGSTPQLRWLHLGADGLDNVCIDLPDPEGAPASAAQVPRPGARTTFLAVASLHPRKAFDLVIDAFDELWADGLDVDLLISGMSWQEVSPGPLVERIRSHPQAGKHLHYCGYLPDEEVQRLYRSCDALVYTSHDEGFGLPVVEAAACGMPSVLRDIPVLREISDRYGFWFGDTGRPSLADALREVDALPADQRRARALPASALLSWTQVTCHLLDLMGIARPAQPPRR